MGGLNIFLIYLLALWSDWFMVTFDEVQAVHFSSAPQKIQSSTRGPGMLDIVSAVMKLTSIGKPLHCTIIY